MRFHLHPKPSLPAGQQSLLSAAALMAIALSFSTSAFGQADIPEEILFNRDVRPIMSNTCFKCHGPDSENNKGDLRLDLPTDAFAPRQRKDGSRITPIVPGNPQKSEAWRRIFSEDPEEVMPPPDNLHQLSSRDKAVIERWIEQGAAYQEHWAYIPPVRSALPELSASRSAHPVDRFVRANLEAKGIAPSPEADRPTLIRRLSLDLTGLPPTAQEVVAFVNDASPQAYEKVVDRLLASPHYGERMAIPWLDITRFADTVGYHGDQRQNNFPYRDYVIEAFNKNKPFDAFTIEQLAGDLLPNPTQEQLIASGFNRLNMMTREGGAQPKEYLAKYAADRVRAVSTTWLGSTMTCAECHDHKYDPFTMKDFYSLAAFFADVKQYGVYSDYRYTPEEELKGWNNDFPFPPEIEVDSPYLARRQARLQKEYDQTLDAYAKTTRSDARQSEALRRWAQQADAFLQTNPSGWASPRPSKAVASNPSTTIELLSDNSVLLRKGPGEAKKSGEEVLSLTLAPEKGSISSLRFEVLPDPAHKGTVCRDDAYRFTANVEWSLQRAGQKNTEAIRIQDGYANLLMENFSNGYIQAAVTSSLKSSRLHAEKRHAIVYYPTQPLQLQEGDLLIAKITSDDVGRVRISHSPLNLEVQVDTVDAALRDALRAEASGEQRILAAKAFVKSDGTEPARRSDLLKRYRAIKECRDGKAFTTITVSTNPIVTRILERGNWKDESGDVVSPAPPGFIAGSYGSETRPLSRLDLARWIASPENPLTARVFVNRLWAQFFGSGFSTVLDDLGSQGEWPNHPELLDWLAVEFMESGWDVKALVRIMVTSETYRQSSRIRPELKEVDPANRLLARQTPRRLEAEFIRDNALFVSGLMDTEIGGPSAHPYQPEDYYELLNFPMRKYQADADERQYRRGIYTHWQRTFLHPMLANFDAPGREECAAQRIVSNTPQQALTLLNDPSFVEAARVAAQKLVADNPDKDFNDRLETFFRQALARAPSAQEQEALSGFFADRLDHYQENPEDAIAFTSIGLAPAPEQVDRSELAAWTALTRVVLNLNESIVRY